MNILIVSHFYEIDGVMGSVRWTSFAHRLAKENNIYVVTHKNDISEPIVVENRNGITVINIDNECNYVKRGKNNTTLANKPETVVLEKTEVNKSPSSIKNILRSLLYVSSMLKSAKKNTKRILDYFSNNQISLDCVITTSRPFIDAFLGYYLIRKIHKPWILDQRDLQHNDGASDFTISYYSNWFRKMDKFVSAYTLVSHGMAESFAKDCSFSEKSQNKIIVLHNGYNKEASAKATSKSRKNCITISYVGDMYLGRRDADMLFAAIKRVITKNPEISEKNFCVAYAGREGAVVKLQAQKYGIESVVHDHGFVSHAESIRIQHEADLLLLLTWNTEMDRGILPGKFYEYMMAEKPIICITCGSVTNGEAEKMVNDMNLGIAVNQINYNSDINRLADYLTVQLNNKREENELVFTPNKEMVSEFDYDNLTQKLNGIIEAIT